MRVVRAMTLSQWLKRRTSKSSVCRIYEWERKENCWDLCLITTLFGYAFLNIYDLDINIVFHFLYRNDSLPFAWSMQSIADITFTWKWFNKYKNIFR